MVPRTRTAKSETSQRFDSQGLPSHADDAINSAGRAGIWYLASVEGDSLAGAILGTEAVCG
jgi:hypothetical protein